MDLSEPGFGVTMLNDCKVGHSCLGNVMGLSLLRSTKSPDATADMGEHTFTYALMPHGRFDAAEALAATEAINQPPRVFEGAAVAGAIANVDAANVVIDSVKPAEDSKGLIVRLYEAGGGRTACKLSLHPGVKTVEKVDLLERPLKTLKLNGHTLTLSLRAFQILSLRLMI